MWTGLSTNAVAMPDSDKQEYPTWLKESRKQDNDKENHRYKFVSFGDNNHH